MKKTFYRITIPLSFPAGLMPGAGSTGNIASISRDGQGRPVLRGTAIAGALRTAFEKARPDLGVETWFGMPLQSDTVDDGTEDQQSSLKIYDLVFPGVFVQERTHNAINRHTKSALDGSLYGIEALPPGAKGNLLIEFDARGSTEASADDELCLSILADLFATGLFFGGSKNRGLGFAVAPEGIFVDKFNLSDAEDYARLLDRRYTFLPDSAPEGRAIRGDANKGHFYLKINIGIPRGEDLLVADGTGMEYDLEPQRVETATGKAYWRIPGSSLRGVFRAWMSRLAAQEGHHIRDNVSHYQKHPEDWSGENVGWGFVSKDERKKYQKNPSALQDPILDLFGSLYGAGRIHVSDALSNTAVAAKHTQARMHVAVDSFSGGANEGALFSNLVLVNSQMEFSVNIFIQDAKPKEKDWLLRSLQALHIGLLSIGSSKSSGRLEIRSVAECSDKDFREKIQNFIKENPN